jgi:hypothetical protein
MKEAAIEHSIDSLLQPPYPIIPANAVFGTLMELNGPLILRNDFFKLSNGLGRCQGHLWDRSCSTDNRRPSYGPTALSTTL